MICPVILSGGAGSRLWPLSREYYPKQLLSLVGKGTLLQQTIMRLDGLPDISAPLLVCNEEHRFLVAEQVRQLDREHLDIILEPVGRNTAPALTLAALALLKYNENALMLVMPADHVIQNTEAFNKAVSDATILAQDGRLVTFGVVPTAPETGYGYIKKSTGNDVIAFIEKPDAATAKGYLDEGGYLWNSGMFLMHTSLWLDELARYRPDVLDACQRAFEQGAKDGEFYRINKQVFASCPSDSIDYAVMEKTNRAAVVSLDAGWSDIGAWSSLWDISEQDAEGNVTQGDVYMHATQNALLIAQHRFLAAVGLEDIVVIETSDAVLVVHKGHAQNVREIVNRLKIEKRSEYQQHRRVHRPWGCFEGIDRGERFQVKRLTINPGASISLQMHQHRAEHWVVVKGTAKVIRGEEECILTENQSTYIPIGEKHRLENPGSIPLEIIEIQSGSYLGEDDIVRFDDHYDRHKN